MNIPFPESGLYAITKSGSWPGESLVDAVSAAIAGGAKVIQYRNKHPRSQAGLVSRLKRVCRKAQVPLIINDNLELARDIGADGVHLGRHDSSILQARDFLGSEALIGVSCYNSVAKAKKAQEDGAAYVAFGRFFPSSSKPDAAVADIEILSGCKLDIPVVAIGGITPENGKQLLSAGADLLAAIDGVFGTGEPKNTALEYAALFDRNQDTAELTGNGS